MAAHGGARNRSGPPPDPNSGASLRKGLTFRSLDRAGYTADAPRFPLPPAPGHDHAREVGVWAEVWRTPQAIAWSEESWRWRTIAMYVRLSVVCEQAPGNGAVLGQLHRFADQIGLTPAGLKENGWMIEAVAPAAAASPDGGLATVVDLFRDGA